MQNGSKIEIKPYLGITSGYHKTGDVVSIITTNLLNTGVNERYLGNSGFANYGIKAGVKSACGPYYADVNATIGSALGGRVKIGSQAKNENGFGVDCSYSVDCLYNLSKHKVVTNCYISDLDTNSSKTEVITKDFNDKYLDLNGSLQFTYDNDWGQVGLGTKLGYRKASDFSANTSQVVVMPEDKKVIINTDLVANKEEVYFSPTVSAKINLNKTGNLSFNAEADKYGGEVGLTWMF